MVECRRQGGPCFRTVVDEFGSSRIARLPTSRMVGSLPLAPYPGRLCSPSLGIVQAISGSATWIMAFFIWLRETLSNGSLGQRWDGRTSPLLYPLILYRAASGLGSIRVAWHTSGTVRSAQRTKSPT